MGTMHADPHDAPRHPQPTRRSQLWRWSFALLAGLSLSLAVLYLIALQLPSPPVPAPPLARIPPAQPAQAAAPLAAPTRPSQTSTASARQTDFNDHNYVPRPADNIISSREIRQSSAYRQITQARAPTQQTVRQQSVTHETAWVRQWSGHARYLAEWAVHNNRVDYASVCTNHRRGSIDYRECRKAVKQHFKRICQQSRERYAQSADAEALAREQRYCSAANGFSPMG